MEVVYIQTVDIPDERWEPDDRTRRKDWKKKSTDYLVPMRSGNDGKINRHPGLSPGWRHLAHDQCASPVCSNCGKQLVTGDVAHQISDILRLVGKHAALQHLSEDIRQLRVKYLRFSQPALSWSTLDFT